MRFSGSIGALILIFGCGDGGIDVVEPDPPPPPPPAGDTIWFDDFSYQGPDLPVSSPGWTRPHGGSAVYAEDGVLNFHWDAGPDQSAEGNFTLGNLYGEVWVQYDLFLPDGFQYTGGGGSKFFTIWDNQNYPGGGAGYVSCFVGAWSQGGPVSRISVSWSDERNPTMMAVSRWWAPGIVDDHKGQWNQVRFHLKVGTYAPNDPFHSGDWGDGVMEMWWNGVKVVDGPMGFYHSDPSRNGFMNGYLFGWSNPGFPTDMLVQIDNLLFLSSNPAW
jgi:hypothetical protein